MIYVNSFLFYSIPTANIKTKKQSHFNGTVFLYCLYNLLTTARPPLAGSLIIAHCRLILVETGKLLSDRFLGGVFRQNFQQALDRRPGIVGLTDLLIQERQTVE